jgi:acetolactate synthase regulatory subunit
MHELRFHTSDPLDHCTRVLDTVRRMGFRLIYMRAAPYRDAEFDVLVIFEPAGNLSVHVLTDRVRGFVGVGNVRLDS